MKAIIPQPFRKQQPLRWQQALSEMITSPSELLSLLDLSDKDIPWQWDKQFPLRVTKSFIQRMKKGDPHDPLLRQVLSLQVESQNTFNYSDDPLQEAQYNPLPGLLHKYSSRVLLTFTTSCAIHCRYCFRRHFPYAENNPGNKGWQAALAYIREDPNIIEVILSGGDPLMAQDEMLSTFLQALALIPHVKLLRFHTRLPVVIPERITQALVDILKSTRLQVTMVYHINHPAEITEEIAKGVALLKQANIVTLNQSVLLKDVNDNLACLTSLSLTLFKAGILPYYLHLLDKVAGAEHFAVNIETGKILQQLLRESLPGYLVPKFVQEIPQALSKTPLDLLVD